MRTIPGSPLDRLLTIGLVGAPTVGLTSTVVYATSGWDDAVAGMLHALAATLGFLLVVRLVTYLDAQPVLAAVALLVGTVGAAGNVAYAFDTISVSLGALPLVDQPGAANLIKPFGLCMPLGFVLLGVGLVRTRQLPAWLGIGIIAAALATPVSRIGNIAWLALVVDLALTVCFVTIAVIIQRTPAPSSGSEATAVGNIGARPS